MQQKTIDVSIPHRLGRDEAKARLQAGAERLRSQFGGQVAKFRRPGRRPRRLQLLRDGPEHHRPDGRRGRRDQAVGRPAVDARDDRGQDPREDRAGGAEAAGEEVRKVPAGCVLLQKISTQFRSCCRRGRAADASPSMISRWAKPICREDLVRAGVPRRERAHPRTRRQSGPSPADDPWFSGRQWRAAGNAR